MTSTVVPLATSGTRDAAPAITPSPFPSFWLLQAGGWLTFAGAMTLSRIGSFPLAFMVASKGTLALLGFLCSLVLWRVYRPLQSGETCRLGHITRRGHATKNAAARSPRRRHLFIQAGGPDPGRSIFAVVLDQVIAGGRVAAVA